MLPCHLLTTQGKTPQHYIIAFGNGSSPNLRGNLPAPSTRFLGHLKSLSGRNVQVSTVIIDEYLTSEVCAECHRRTLVNLREQSKLSMSSGAAGQKIHAVLKYTSCSTVWNQDVNGGQEYATYFRIRGAEQQERPEAFKRPDTTNAVEGTGPRQAQLSAG